MWRISGGGTVEASLWRVKARIEFEEIDRILAPAKKEEANGTVAVEFGLGIRV